MAPGNARPERSEGKRHRKDTAAAQAGVRVKRWGKSPPQTGQPEWHGKPRQEQRQIGAPRDLSQGLSAQGSGLAA